MSWKLLQTRRPPALAKQQGWPAKAEKLRSWALLGRRGVTQGAQLLGAGQVREQLCLKPIQQPVNRVGEQANDHQNQNDVLGEPTPLAGAEQIAEPVLRIDQLGQHDVAEREAEQTAEIVVDTRQRQC